MASDTTLVTAKPRCAKNSIGSIGASVRRSWTMKATISSTPAASETSTSVLVQPSDWLRISPYTIPNSPAEPSPSPARSSRRAGPWLSASRARASGTSVTPIGTLIQKIQCHEAACTTAPPTSGPSATAIPLTPDQTPSAIPRRSGGKASASSVSVSGVTIAAPTPCVARAAISRPIDGASAAAAEDSVNSADPDHEHPSAAVAVAERCAGQQQHGVGEHVGVHGPLERLDRGAEVAVDARQGDAHDEVVEHHHEQSERHDRQGPTPPARLRHVVIGPPSDS